MKDLKDETRSEEREEMVRNHLMARGIRNSRVLEAFRKVPRHLFVPKKYQSQAYEDYPVSIGEGQTISQPYIVAAMIEILDLKGDEKVLEVGTGSGYESALLAELAREVYTVERVHLLYEGSQERLRQMGYHNIHFLKGDGSRGWSEYAPYEAMIVSAAAPKIPKPLLDQLDEGGRLVLPEGGEVSQVLTRVTKVAGSFKKESYCGCVFVPLVGEYGWEE